MEIRRSRVWDYVLYFLIAIVVAASAFVPSLLNISLTEYKRWFGLIFGAFVILGVVIEGTRTLWGKKIYWVFMGTAVGVNSVMLVVLAVEKISVSGFMLMCTCFIEICVIRLLKSWAVRNSKMPTIG